MIEHQYEDLCYLQFDHYQQFPNLIHGIFTRAGGHSAPPFQGLNTSRGISGDSLENIVYNRMRALQALQLEHNPCVTLWQVHSAEVIAFSLQDPWRTDWARHSYFTPGWTPETIHKGDALITQERGAALALSFADCTPIIFYDPIKQVIAITHGGWRGTARGIAIATVEALDKHFGCAPQDIYAGIGPAIGPCCYEVSTEVQQIFQGHKSFDEMPTHRNYRGRVCESAVFSTRQLPEKTSLRLDLQETNHNQLLLAGLEPAHIEIMRICTSCHTERFFSHRRENGKTGRFAVIISLQPAGQ